MSAVSYTGSVSDVDVQGQMKKHMYIISLFPNLNSFLKRKTKLEKNEKLHN